MQNEKERIIQAVHSLCDQATKIDIDNDLSLLYGFEEPDREHFREALTYTKQVGAKLDTVDYSLVPTTLINNFKASMDGLFYALSEMHKVRNQRDQMPSRFASFRQEYDRFFTQAVNMISIGSSIQNVESFAQDAKGKLNEMEGLFTEMKGTLRSANDIVQAHGIAGYSSLYKRNLIMKKVLQKAGLLD